MTFLMKKYNSPVCFYDRIKKRLKNNLKYMNKIIIVFLLVVIVAVVLFFMFYPAEEEFVSDVVEVNSFDECVAVGNPIMESYPRRCRHGEVTFVEDISNRVFECDQDQRDAEFCIEIYEPVCAEVNVQCITTPCPPVLETFSNSCKACQNSLIESYTIGECVVE